ncbi:putative signal peptide protein [Puccinia sorghi]|uniref:Putative signal peptide protein n=1 Tax=Puccinia sorghi TaxID=27349 RepID=A0A0L6UPK1_9BASI|nr:putative signal peptide protein [Puccinia sorghi]
MTICELVFFFSILETSCLSTVKLLVALCVEGLLSWLLWKEKLLAVKLRVLLCRCWVIYGFTAEV